MKTKPVAVHVLAALSILAILAALWLFGHWVAAMPLWGGVREDLPIHWQIFAELFVGFVTLGGGLAVVFAAVALGWAVTMLLRDLAVTVWSWALSTAEDAVAWAKRNTSGGKGK